MAPLDFFSVLAEGEDVGDGCVLHEHMSVIRSLTPTVVGLLFYFRRTVALTRARRKGGLLSVL